MKGGAVYYKVARIEGIGPANARKLARARVRTTCSLLKQCGDRIGRKPIAERTGFKTTTLLKWANIAELMRVHGIGEEYAELLEAAGVDTVKELRTRRADNLTATLARINDDHRLVRRVSSEIEVGRWITEAKSLRPVISH